MQPDFLAVVVAVLGVSITVNGYFVKSALVELRELRAADRQREVDVARLAERVDVITDGCPRLGALQLARGMNH